MEVLIRVDSGLLIIIPGAGTLVPKQDTFNVTKGSPQFTNPRWMAKGTFSNKSFVN